MEMVTIHRTFDPAEAQIIVTRLQTAGFNAELNSELSAQNFEVAAGGTRVQVPDDQAEEARAFLASGENAPDEQP